MLPDVAIVQSLADGSAIHQCRVRGVVEIHIPDLAPMCCGAFGANAVQYNDLFLMESARLVAQSNHMVTYEGHLATNKVRVEWLDRLVPLLGHLLLH
eukprot:3356644-Pyramimonas_sp.AAC.1